MARQASLERFRLKKSRRAIGGGLPKVKYIKRSINADKRVRSKNGRFVANARPDARFVQADAAAAILAEAQAGTDAA